MPLIRIVATGGTIANTAGGLIDVRDVLKDIPEAAGLADIEVVEATRVRSGSMRLPQWLDIGRAVADAAADPRVDGVIVTHGTFTVEETAYLLHLTIPTEKPLVLVAAQRMHDVLDPYDRHALGTDFIDGFDELLDLMLGETAGDLVE